MVVVKKKKPKARGLTFQQRLDHELQVFMEQSIARASIAKRAYAPQDAETKAALDTMVDRIVSISRGVATFKIGKRKVAAEVPTEAVKNNALYLATEILKDLALLDIRIANFRFDPQRCAECGKPIVRKVRKK
jgi:hypothetical protein